MVLGCPEPVRFGLKMLADLKTKLLESQSDEVVDTDESDGAENVLRLHLWVSYVGSLAEKVHPISGSDAKLFSTRVKEMVRRLGVGDWEAMKRILKSFLFCQLLHQEIEQGKPFRKEDFRQGLYTSSGTSWRQPLSADSEQEAPESSMSKAEGKQKADVG
jgi:hypothetical protein